MPDVGVTIIDAADIDLIASRAVDAGYAIYRFNTKGATGRTAFFDAIRHTLPLDPPLVGSRSWDALSDSLWSGLHKASDSSVVIFWTESSEFKNTASPDYSVALEIFKDITRSLADYRVTNGRPTQVSVYIS